MDMERYKDVRKMTRKELLSIPARSFGEEIRGFTNLIIIPSKEKHPSGYLMLDLIACYYMRPFARFGGCCDDLELDFDNVRVDYLPKSRCACIRSGSGEDLLNTTADISSIRIFKQLTTNQE